VASPDDHSEFFTAPPGGRRARLIREFPSLAPNGCAHRYPSWSPDGQRIVYMSGDAIAVGTSARRGWRRDRMVTPRGLWPAWSPDGRRIAFILPEGDGPASSLATIGVRGGPIRRLVTTSDSQEWPSWNPDGRHILYSTNVPGTPGQVHMWRVPATGGRPRSLGVGRSPDTSPDGRKIAFITGDAVWTMNPDGSGRRKVTGHPPIGMVWRLAWSPDGTRIAYIYYPVETSGPGQVRIVHSTGRGDHRVRLPRRVENPGYVHWGSG
jgi:Tol biopolymer transport system component